MSERPEHIPDHWEDAAVADLTEFVTSGSRGWASYYSEDGALFLRVGNLDHDTIALNLSDVQRVRPPDSAEGKRTSVQTGDVLLSITAEVGMVGLAREQLGEAYVNQHVALIRPLPGVWPSGLAFAFLDPQGMQAVVKRAQYGATKPGLSLIQVRGFRVGVPPLGEQQRIVQAIESHFSRLDDAVATLERVQRNLERYRASVLKAAVEGRLVSTEAQLAREEGRDYEPASALLERILAERRRRWEEAELARLSARGKVPSSAKWKANYKAPAAPDSSALPELPEGWCWATVEQLTSGDRRAAYGVLVPGPDLPDGVGFIRVGDINDGRVDLSGVKRISREIADQFSKTYLAGGELLISLVGTIGRTAVAPSSAAGFNVARAVGVVPLMPVLNPHWVEVWFRSPMQRGVMVSQAHEVARKTLNLEDVRRAVVALPPVSEQHRIAAAVSDTESVGEAVLKTVVLQMARLARLRQAVLKWAFEGKLTDPDPTDEPASALLERLKAKREAPASNGGAHPARRNGTQTAKKNASPKRSKKS